MGSLLLLLLAYVRQPPSLTPSENLSLKSRKMQLLPVVQLCGTTLQWPTFNKT